MRVTSDGTVTGTRLYDDEGHDITHNWRVKKLVFTHEAGDIPQLLIECLPEILQFDVTVLDDNAIRREYKPFL